MRVDFTKAETFIGTPMLNEQHVPRVMGHRPNSFRYRVEFSPQTRMGKQDYLEISVTPHGDIQVRSSSGRLHINSDSANVILVNVEGLE